MYLHEFAQKFNLPTDAQFYMTFNMNMLRRAECMFQLELKGWEDSKGMEVERKVAQTLTIPIIRYDADFNNLTEQLLN